MVSISPGILSCTLCKTFFDGGGVVVLNVTIDTKLIEFRKKITCTCVPHEHVSQQNSEFNFKAKS